jgi:prepilin-type N-terminal cleavage/methylation domain-containing protein
MVSLKERKQQGFTIVELLIVIVVIGILAGLVITTYNGIQQKARNTERNTDLKADQGQLEAYYASNGRYPALSDLGGTNTSAQDSAFIKANMKGLDPEALRDPKAAAGDYTLATSPTANKYAYQPTNDGGTACDDSGTNDCTHYVLTAKQEGGGADIVYNSLN